jgi:hypothetical protein
MKVHKQTFTLNVAFGVWSGFSIVKFSNIFRIMNRQKILWIFFLAFYGVIANAIGILEQLGRNCVFIQRKTVIFFFCLGVCVFSE